MISIIIPLYNARDYIEKCLDSLINQSYREIEIIVIDDGSTDDSLELCKSKQRLDDRIKIFEQKNQGPVLARKRGLGLSNGEYVTFVDADDYVEPEMYSRLLGEMGNEIDFVHSGYFAGEDKSLIGTIDNLLIHPSLDEKAKFIGRYVLDYSSTECVSPSMWSKLYRRDFICRCFELIPESITFGEDLILLCVCVMECVSSKFVNEAFYHYVSNEKSITHNIGIKRIGQIVDLDSAMRNVLSRYDLGHEIYNYLDGYTKWTLASYLMKMTHFCINRYRLLNIHELIGKAIIIYGAGQVGQDVYSQVSKYTGIEIVDWVDRNPVLSFEYAKVSAPCVIFERNFDYIVIAIKDREISERISNELETRGIDKKKIIIGQIGIWI